ncbi:MAG: hydroxymethylbilane synthase [Sphingomonadales bacterium 35-56-22]|uniref:hydroxymethylbilane synthase n=1 Tax=Sphingorhabdus sp. TaxID=1902408 RepID=UPI000BCC5A76|nr:hydroxymethylbilane synthase [Sphingorhabdus sp.]OYY15172.1 MAG: hydroxymethylbilane synthase [Sphingomonadales bacterium 35-56-22]OYY97437.1 MAG: hydroxymethylbilane synthase [Sphingomonadales bacterium 28-56-43]OYZ60192.1 MAG: hydroxymethylbilane synthase [Sphingomonadales bacterium 24-56-14]OZA82462.1 MAG: hydroxymethylbilane synthase [Sphingomonadales bacterium 39-57-19]HQS13345.1 hydroxymethylbilane synthase [Sphingorhabdus sp.]
MISFSSDRPLRIGTRRSPLALAQAEMTMAAIKAAHNLPDDAVVLVPMLATGDKIQDRPLAEIGGKALWTKELERALIDDQIDIAVHSMKDVETVRADIFDIAAMLPRADMRDRLIGAASLDDLKHGARVGTSSPRRAAQLQRARPDVRIVPLRGNVATRLAHIENGDADATLLAAAGLDRLGMANVGAPLPLSQFLPAASQGAVGIDRLTSRSELVPFLAAINDVDTFVAVNAERALLEALGGNCHSPIAALAQVEGSQIRLKGEVFTADGREMHADEIVYEASSDGPAQLADQLLANASDELRSMFAS